MFAKLYCVISGLVSPFVRMRPWTTDQLILTHFVYLIVITTYLRKCFAAPCSIDALVSVRVGKAIDDSYWFIIILVLCETRTRSRRLVMLGREVLCPLPSVMRVYSKDRLIRIVIMTDWDERVSRRPRFLLAILFQWFSQYCIILLQSVLKTKPVNRFRRLYPVLIIVIRIVQYYFVKKMIIPASISAGCWTEGFVLIVFMFIVQLGATWFSFCFGWLHTSHFY